MTRSAYIHPTLLLSLTDHLHRAKSIYSLDPMLGLILGRSSKESVSLLYAFEIPSSEKKDYQNFKQHLLLLSEVYGKGYLQLVGFYTINSANNKDALHDQYALLKTIIDLNDSIPTLISSLDINDTIFLNYTNSKIQIHSAVDNEESISFEIRYMEAEKISISTYNNAPKIPISNGKGKSTTNDNTDVKDIRSGLDDLNEKLNNALIFLNETKKGRINTHQDPLKYQTLQALSDLAGQITAMKAKLKESKETTENSSSEIENLDRLIALGSLTSSIFRENLNHSI